MTTQRVRYFYDVEVDEIKTPTEHQRDVVAKNNHSYGHQIAHVDIPLDDDDLIKSNADPVYGAHVHDATQGYCQGCVAMAGDGLN